MAAHAVSKTPDEFSKSFYDRLTGISPDFIPVVSCGITSTTMKKSSLAQTMFLQGPEFQPISVKHPQLQNFDSIFMRFLMNVFA